MVRVKCLNVRSTYSQPNMSDLCLYINEDKAQRSERRRCSPDMIYCCCDGANNNCLSGPFCTDISSSGRRERGTFELDLSQFLTH